jgi:hypothetical protein
MRSFSQLVKDCGIAPTQRNLHSIGSDMQFAIDHNIAAAKAAGVDADCCWACHNVEKELSSGVITVQPRGASPECVVEITCPVCDGTGSDHEY